MDHIEALISEYSELEGLEVDRAASSNAVGYYRLPCTYNTSAKRFGTLQVLHTERYDTHELAGTSLPFQKKTAQNELRQLRRRSRWSRAM